MKLVLKFNINTGKTSVSAIDLTGDCWRDYLYYMSQAQEHMGASDSLQRTRLIKAALINLFSHLDGVVSALYTHLEKTSKTFSPPSTNGRDCSLMKKISHLRTFARKDRGENIPYLHLNLKLLRDILAHPNIYKERTQDNGQIDILTESDVVNLSLNNISKEGDAIDHWLNKLCAVFKFRRKYDTEAICKEWSCKLGSVDDMQEF